MKYCGNDEIPQAEYLTLSEEDNIELNKYKSLFFMCGRCMEEPEITKYSSGIPKITKYYIQCSHCLYLGPTGRTIVDALYAWNFLVDATIL